MLQDEIKELERKLMELKRQMQLCNHRFDMPRQNTYISKEEYHTGRYEQNVGIHMWPIMAYRDVTKVRWTRKCTLCGLEQHTEKQKAVSPPQLAPDFD